MNMDMPIESKPQVAPQAIDTDKIGALVDKIIAMAGQLKGMLDGGDGEEFGESMTDAENGPGEGSKIGM